MTRTLIAIFLFILIFSGCMPKTANKISVGNRISAPNTFKAKFTTTKGDFYAEFYRELAPIGVERAYNLLESGFYTDIAIFRVQPDYVIQFGISDSLQLNEYWKAQVLPDEKNRGHNQVGTISFARAGENSRTTQLFINVNDNRKLDTIEFNDVRGFPVIGKIYDGMENVKRFYAGYAFEPATKQDSIMKFGNDYLRRNYPKLDYILKAEIIEE